MKQSCPFINIKKQLIKGLPTFYLLIFVIFFKLPVQGQANLAYNWNKGLINAQPMGGSIQGRSVAIDGAGNLYVIGNFAGTADFDPGAGIANLSSIGANDVFFAKYSNTGAYLFAKRIGGTSQENGNDIAVDGSGNIYITGDFVNTTDFDPGEGVVSLTSNASSFDIYFAKYDATGNILFVKSIASNSTDTGNSLTVDAGGNIFIGGIFNGTADFDPGPATASLTSVGNSDIFFARYNTSGNYIYAKSAGSVGAESLTSVSIDGSGNVYITGYFTNTTDFDPGAGIVFLTSAGLNDIYIAKYDASGNYVYAKRFGSTSTDQGNAAGVDAAGNIYVTGVFRGTVDFDPGAGSVNLSAGGQDIFIAKYDGSGNYSYAKKIGSTNDEEARNLVADASGNICITGNFVGTVDFDPGAGTVNLASSSGSYDIYFARYDASGNYLMAKNVGGTNTEDGISIVSDVSNNVYITGLFNNTVDFDPGAGIANLTTGNGFTNGFIASYTSTGVYRFAGLLGGHGNTFYGEQGSGIVSDASNNVYITGYFTGTVDFDPGAGTANLTSAGDQDIFIAKYDASGNYVYAKAIGSTARDNGLSIAIDGSSNIYITGLFDGTVDFDPGAGVANLVSAGSADIFIAKYDVSGNYSFAKRIGGTTTENGNSLVLDATGNIYLSGHFSGTVDFDPGAGTANLVSAGSFPDIFIAKYDATGNYIYAKGMGGTGDDRASNMVVDASGNAYITGHFSGTADFDPGAATVNLVSGGGVDIFFAKYNSTGDYVYANRIGGFSGDSGVDLAVDATGNLYLTGNFFSTMDFDPGPGTANLAGSSSTDIFIAKYDPAGNYLFAKQVGNPSNGDFPKGISFDPAGYVYVCGYYTGTADFNPGAGVANLSSSSIDIFILKLDQNGDYQYAKGMGGTGNDIAFDIAIDALGNIFITGNFEGTADLDPNSGTANEISLNGSDIFVGRYTECSSPVMVTSNTNSTTTTISGATPVTDGGCKLLLGITPSGTNPVSGTVTAKVWVESSVLTYSGQPFVARHYEITPATNPTTATAKVTLYFTQQEFDNFNAHTGSTLNLPTNDADAAGKANLRIGKYAGSSNNGSGLPGTYSSTAMVIDPSDNDIVWNSTFNRWEVSFDVIGFSGFIVQTSNFTLPLTLLEFNGRLSSGNAVLNWKTSDEINTRDFVIERSLDGRNYSAAGTISAMNTTGTHQYSFSDPSIATWGVNVIYYRLKQTDIDGRVTYSRIVALSLDKSILVMLYPNPVTDKANLTITIDRAEKARFRILDNTGRVIRQQQLNLQPGSISMSMDLKDLARGVYYLELKGETIGRRIKILKQ